MTLWNEAMKYYDCMTDIGMGYFINAETGAWENVLSHIKFLVDELEISLDCEFTPPYVDIGLRRRRHKLTTLCAKCKNVNGDKKCSRCKKVFIS